MTRRVMSVAPLWVATAFLLLLWICVRPGGAEPTYADILLGVVIVIQVVICILDQASRPPHLREDEDYAQPTSQFRRKVDEARAPRLR